VAHLLNGFLKDQYAVREYHPISVCALGLRDAFVQPQERHSSPNPGQLPSIRVVLHYHIHVFSPLRNSSGRSSIALAANSSNRSLVIALPSRSSDQNAAGDFSRGTDHWTAALTSRTRTTGMLHVGIIAR
jgi:hypothetical protein